MLKKGTLVKKVPLLIFILKIGLISEIETD